jgi:hypothetical protein
VNDAAITPAKTGAQHKSFHTDFCFMVSCKPFVYYNSSNQRRGCFFVLPLALPLFNVRRFETFISNNYDHAKEKQKTVKKSSHLPFCSHYVLEITVARLYNVN